MKRNNNNKTTAKKAAVTVTTKKVVMGQKKKKKANKPQTRGGANLSPCAADYAYALRDPFDGPLACVPSSYPPIPTYKVRVFSRGVGVVGTGGHGFVMANPRRMAANDIGGVYYSISTYAGGGFPATTATLGVTTANSNSPFSYAALGTGTPTAQTAQYRIVASGVRSWYNGTNLNLSGETLGFRQPDNDSILNLAYGDLLGFDNVRRVACTSDRLTTETLWIPTKPGDLEFSGVIDDVIPLGHDVQGVPGTTFSWEIFNLYEFIGRNVQGKSLSHADPAGFAAVLTAAQSEGDTWVGSARQAGASLVEAARQGLSSLSGVIGRNGPALINLAGNAGMMYMRGGLGTLDPGPNLLSNGDSRSRKITVEEPLDVIDERTSEEKGSVDYTGPHEVRHVAGPAMAEKAMLGGASSSIPPPPEFLPRSVDEIKRLVVEYMAAKEVKR